MSYNLSILSKFPAVQSFSMNGWGQLQDRPDVLAEASSVLPALHQPLRNDGLISPPLHSHPSHHRVLQSLTLRSEVAENRGIEQHHFPLCEFQRPRRCWAWHSLRAVPPDSWSFPTESPPMWRRLSSRTSIPGLRRSSTSFMDISKLPATLERLALTWELKYKEMEEALLPTPPFSVEATAEDAEYGSPRVDSRALHEEFRLEWPLYIPTATHAASRQRKGLKSLPARGE
ncbi:hypothetical protein B0H14DRAFT_2611417 [Mycena olivaceomarginata]|nr:hypothetical protein B0H14DRAFT_2611417 [Mycena olivaceomarginata]